MVRIPKTLICTAAMLLLVGLIAGLLLEQTEGAAAQASPLPIRPQQAAGGTSPTATQPRAWAIILLIGDGMGATHRTAARWATLGQNGALAMDSMTFEGWARTSSADSSVTDSAAAATALATGVKTNNGMISQDPEGKRLTTILEQARAKGMAVGLVTTVQMAHATPAAFAAHVPDRSMMTEIAGQMLAAGVDVLLGGGEDEFLPPAAMGCYPEQGERADGRNLIDEAVAAGYKYVCDATALAAVDPASTSRLLGLFADEGMVRPYSPSLPEMAQKAIDILSQDPDGFFLMVEGGQIDWASHDNDASNTISDTAEFDEAVGVVRAYASTTSNVLIVVTADHETGGMSTDLTSSGLPGEDGPFYMPDGTVFYVNWTTGSHTAADVPTTAQGPWSSWLTSTYENTHIYDVMYTALRSWLQVQISGPQTGWTDTTYAFTASVTPITATTPFTYFWQATAQEPVTKSADLSNRMTFTWDITGVLAITVTAANAEGMVSSQHPITLSAKQKPPAQDPPLRYHLPQVLHHFP